MPPFIDFTLLFGQLLVLWWLIPLLILVALMRSPAIKGWFGELMVRIAASLKLPKSTYHAIHDVTLQTDDGTTQIDHIFVSCFGVFVVETKNMQGWIFGRERQARWTQKIYKSTVQFQNPLRQNFKHTKAIESLLDLDSKHIHSVVVFIGSSEFKTEMPANVSQGVGFIRYILSFKEEVLSVMEVKRIVLAIQSGRLQEGRETNRAHVSSLKQRFEATASTNKIPQPPLSPNCPACGNEMIRRIAQRGSYAGMQFWGCSKYPKCKYIINS